MKMPKLITFAAILFAVVYFAGNSNQAFAATGNDGILSDTTKKEAPVKAKPADTPVEADTTKSEK